jgi:bifunctional UDP-N-acetylglucosamine pyrophosphorylase / glucosamine-1-phosphate N-acetyltransferase
MSSSDNRSVVALLLAAGKGTRMQSRYPKALHPLLGKPMGRYGIDLARRLGIERVLVVVGHGAKEVREALGGDVEYVEQAEQQGTGHAVLSAAGALSGHEGTLLILQADNVLLTEREIAPLLARRAKTGAALVILTAVLEDPATCGRVLRGPDGSVARIVEARGAPPEVLAVRETNAGAYACDSGKLFQALQEIPADPATGEIYLTDVVQALLERGERVEAVEAEDPPATRNVNDRIELAQAIAVWRERLLREHMLAGVTIEDPASTFIEAGVTIGQDTVIRPMTFLGAGTVIGEECEIGPFVRISRCTLGDRVSVQNAVLAESAVADETKIGPFAQLRPGCRVGRKVKIGNFVELKKAEVEDRVSLGHFAYIGDAFIGEKTNVGAGTITCNYDGKHKHVTRIGRNAFVGTHSTLVAPVEIGDGAYTAAGSVITQDVPSDALAVGRSRQANKEGWARRRRELQGDSGH